MSGTQDWAKGSHNDNWTRVFLERLADEIKKCEVALSGFQNDLSLILKSAHISPSQVRRLQTLDYTTQTLDDLAQAARIIACESQAGKSATFQILNSQLRLGGVKYRLFREEVSERTDDSAIEGDVNLF
ncbi:hypothetical protein [Aliiruegeria sabulilitoris]|uniref:hypothetical protein n=1 Tax=Aliiruegeria sabulilitoris TaxID=1510458 RepID=UPI000832C59F|nr:hypothetical protein [Aliiruegeria sabulilitoris]NDR58099.1 hypothetical protein [Pseudoruegeria sp. M32A2M]